MLLKNRLASSKNGKTAVAPALQKDAQALLEMPADVAKSLNNYSSNPAALLQWREKVGRMLEKLK